MSVKTIKVQNTSATNSEDLAGYGLKPGETQTFEVSTTHYYEIVAHDSIEVLEESDWKDASDVEGVMDPDAVKATRDEVRSVQASVEETNAEVPAFHNARFKANQLGIDLREIESTNRDGDEITIHDVIAHRAKNANPVEGWPEGGARPQTRVGIVPVGGKVANIRPVGGFPRPIQDGTGKPAQEGHSLEEIYVDSEGLPARRKVGPETAIGSQDEHKAPQDHQEVRSSSAPAMGHQPVDPDEPLADMRPAHEQPGGETAHTPRAYSPPHADQRSEVPRNGEGGGVSETDEDGRGAAAEDDLDPDAQNDSEGDEDPTEGAEDGVNASPAARRKADELGVDITTVKGTGKEDSILVRDVENAAENREG